MKNSRLKFISSMVVVALALALVLTPSLPAEASRVKGVDIYIDIAYYYPDPPYGQGNLLDLYIPDIPGAVELPLVIYHEGSAWLSDSSGKMIPPDILDYFIQQGYAVAGVNVRSSFQVNFPGQLLDIRAAIRWLRENADDYNIDPDRFAIMGTSSGGWLAAIAATTSDIWEFDGETGVQTSSAVQAAVPCSPPTDFLEMDAWYDAHPGIISLFTHDLPYDPLAPPWIPIVFASPESLLVGCTDGPNLLGIQDCPEMTEEANPITYIDGDEPLMHIFHAYYDPLVPHGQSELLYEALAEAGNEVWFTSVPNNCHTFYNVLGIGPDIIDASDYTVYRTNPGGQEEVYEAPDDDYAPTLENIENFISNALNRARVEAVG
jgi:acetyl esterase/lipase